ncbi:MAG: hypothetical protein AB8B51_19660 [Sedimentitalea sp.]
MVASIGDVVVTAAGSTINDTADGVSMANDGSIIGGRNGIGNSANNSILGNSGANRLLGLSADDFIAVLECADTVRGGAGDFIM